MFNTQTVRIICAASLMTLAGCAGTAFKWSDARKIKTDMTTQEVVQLVGRPNNIKSADGKIIYVWVYVNTLSGTNRTLRVDFKDDKVIAPPQIPESFQD